LLLISDIPHYYSFCGVIRHIANSDFTTYLIIISIKEFYDDIFSCSNPLSGGIKLYLQMQHQNTFNFLIVVLLRMSNPGDRLLS